MANAWGSFPIGIQEASPPLLPSEHFSGEDMANAWGSFPMGMQEASPLVCSYFSPNKKRRSQEGDHADDKYLY